MWVETCTKRGYAGKRVTPVGGCNGTSGRGKCRTTHRFNLMFHGSLIELTCNAKFAATYRKLVKELSLFRRQRTSASMAVFSKEHRQIVKGHCQQRRS
jgi:DNA-binding FadR family transcriptional regulator